MTTFKHFLALTLTGAMLAGAVGCAPAGHSASGSVQEPSSVSQTRQMISCDPVYPTALAADDYEGRANQREQNQADDAFLAGLSDFSARSAGIILSGEEGNVCYSPLSLSMALSMLTAGTGGDSQAQLLSALGMEGQDIQWLAQQNGTLLRYLWREDENGGLKLANSLWVDQDALLKEEYADLAAEEFYAASREVDFSSGDVAAQMSQWISDQTNGLLKPDLSTDPDQLLAIINTLYFKDSWREPFAAQVTTTETFTTGDGRQVQADFLNGVFTGHSYAKGEGYIKTALPFAGGSQMILILPDEGVSPSDLLENPDVAAQLFSAEMDQPADVTLACPKFSFDTTLDLVEAMKAMGVTDIFGDQADLSGMLEQSAYVSSIQQGTHVAVDENGAEAAAYTSIGINAMSAPLPLEQVTIRLDRPFIFAINSDNGVQLFTGIVSDPTA